MDRVALCGKEVVLTDPATGEQRRRRLLCGDRHRCRRCARFREKRLKDEAVAIYMSGEVERMGKDVVDVAAVPLRQAHRLLERLQFTVGLPVRRGGLEEAKSGLLGDLAALKKIYGAIEVAGINVIGLRARHAALTDQIRRSRAAKGGGMDVYDIRGVLRALEAELDDLTNYAWQRLSLTTSEPDAFTQMKTLKAGICWMR